MRKSKLAEQIEDSTEKFKNEAREIKDDLAKIQQRLIGTFNNKEMIQDQAEFLIEDRGPIGADKKYFTSIQKFVELAKSLKLDYEKLHNRILNLDNELSIDPLYTVQ